MKTPLAGFPNLGEQYFLYEVPTFLYSQPCRDLDKLDADIAYLGIPYGRAYTFGAISNDQGRAPTALRRASDRILRSPERFDFDLNGPLYDGKAIRVVDCGDVYSLPTDYDGHPHRAEMAVRKILSKGALPIILGGDHSITIPVVRAMDEQGPITLIQLDQHLDWRDNVNDVREGKSSPIRRASEMKHVKEIFQIGLHSTGSARLEEYNAAKAYGAHLITSYEVREKGMASVLERIPNGGRYYVTIDLDAFDAGIAPAVGAPCPGGLGFMEARQLLHGLVRKGRVVGLDIVEITPSTDINQITSITAGRLVVNFVGAAVRAGYFDR